jgi:hypothetical protein
MTTRNLKSVLLTYDDDSTLELEIIDEQGYHRTSEYVGARGRCYVHEVYLTYGEKDGPFGPSSTDQGH